MLALKDAVQATVMLFIIMDPLGNAPLFFAYTRTLSSAARRKIICISVYVATGLLVFFGLFGQPFFRFFGVTLSDFRIAGGIILFIYGVIGILGRSDIERIEEPESLAIVPFATPLLAGPGAIATVIYTRYNWGLATTMFSIFVNAVIALALLLMGERILRVIGKNGSLLLVRLFSMILAAIAISMIRQGVAGFIK